jgi:hypothetical protein
VAAATAARIAQQDWKACRPCTFRYLISLNFPRKPGACKLCQFVSEWNKFRFALSYPAHSLEQQVGAMKWYYEWRLKRVRSKIQALEQETSARLAEDYTAHSQLRVLVRLADGLQQKLARYPAYAAGRGSKEAC